MVTAPAVTGPLDVPCGFCEARPGYRCRSSGGRERRSHARRVRLAWILAAHSDPVLDVFFPQLGQCGLCGLPGLDQRHRVVDAVAGMLSAGEDVCEVAEDYGLRVEAVRVVAAWSRRWPGALRPCVDLVKMTRYSGGCPGQAPGHEGAPNEH